MKKGCGELKPEEDDPEDFGLRQSDEWRGPLMADANEPSKICCIRMGSSATFDQPNVVRKVSTCIGDASG